MRSLFVILSFFFPLAIVLYCWSLFVYFVLFFLWPLCCMADHYLSILSFFSFGHCAVLLITVCLCCPCFPLAIVLYCWSLFVYFILFLRVLSVVFSIYGFWLTLWYLQTVLCILSLHIIFFEHCWLSTIFRLNIWIQQHDRWY